MRHILINYILYMESYYESQKIDLLTIVVVMDLYIEQDEMSTTEISESFLIISRKITFPL